MYIQYMLDYTTTVPTMCYDLVILILTIEILYSVDSINVCQKHEY
jgi:hypothetical protein